MARDNEDLEAMAKEFLELLVKGEQLQKAYSRGEPIIEEAEQEPVMFQDLLDHIKSIQRVQGEIQNLMIVLTTRFYGKCKVIRDRKTRTELERERKRNITQLGFGE